MVSPICPSGYTLNKSTCRCNKTRKLPKKIDKKPAAKKTVAKKPAVKKPAVKKTVAKKRCPKWYKKKS